MVAIGRLVPIVVALVLLSACAGRGGPRGPVVSPTGIVYEEGVPPFETRWSQTAGLYIRSGNAERALEFALEGVEADPGNPIHHFLAGLAHARLEQYEEAHRSLSEAQRLYPAYELDVEPEREAAWAVAFNAGAESYAEGDLGEAIEAWKGAVVIFDLRPEAHRSLAVALQEEGRYEEAVDVYLDALDGLARRPATRILSDEQLAERDDVTRRIEGALAEMLLVTSRFAEAEPLLKEQLLADPENSRLRQNLALALGAQGKRDEAAELYDSLLDDGTLEATQLFNLGVALFRAGDPGGAARAFGRLTELRPYSRDVWFNYANALFAAGDWTRLATVGDRLVEMDPLNENAALLAARAHLESGDEERAIDGVRRIEAAPVHLEGIALRPGPGGARLEGRVTGNAAAAGDEVRLRFVLFRGDAAVGTETVVVVAPGPGGAGHFEVLVSGEADAYRYEVLEEVSTEG